MSTLSREWAISMGFSIVLLLVFGLGLVWLNIERVDLAYELNKIQRQTDDEETLVAKLEVERNTLITPARLRELARQYGLGPAKPGQIRRVNAAGAVETSRLVLGGDDSGTKAQGKPQLAAKTQTTTKSALPAAGRTKGKHKP